MKRSFRHKCGRAFLFLIFTVLAALLHQPATGYLTSITLLACSVLVVALFFRERGRQIHSVLWYFGLVQVIVYPAVNTMLAQAACLIAPLRERISVHE